jgi:PIN domain nuclease of toxin-antitoxin system
MKYLLDTHALLWLIYTPERLSKVVYDILENENKEIYTSTINFWEISIKSSINKLDLKGYSPIDLLKICKDYSFLSLNVNIEDAASIFKLESYYHRDPFDRMLIWQAMQNNLTIITNDAQIEKYRAIGLKTIW